MTETYQQIFSDFKYGFKRKEEVLKELYIFSIHHPEKYVKESTEYLGALYAFVKAQSTYHKEIKRGNNQMFEKFRPCPYKDTKHINNSQISDTAIKLAKELRQVPRSKIKDFNAKFSNIRETKDKECKYEALSCIAFFYPKLIKVDNKKRVHDAIVSIISLLEKNRFCDVQKVITQTVTFYEANEAKAKLNN